MPRIQFSLKFFLVACMILGLCLAFVLRAFQSHQRLQDSISGVFNNSTSGNDFNFSFTGYLDHRDEPVAFVLFVIEDEVPKMRRTYGYKTNVGGVLVIDDQQVEPSSSPWLFVNGPYGHTVKLELNEAETKALMTIRSARTPQLRIVKFWRDVVEARIYETDGQLVDGERDGLWTFRLSNGDKYSERGYKLGKRHGPWTTYYPNGQIRAQLQFDNGKASGTWTYFNEEGQMLASGPASDWRIRFGHDGGALWTGGTVVPTPDLPPDVETMFPHK